MGVSGHAVARFEVVVDGLDHGGELLPELLALVEGEAADNLRPGGFYQARQFVQIIAGSLTVGQLDADQNGRLA